MAKINVTLSKGPKGDKGDTGAQGVTGPQGPQGDQGIQGVQGPASSPAPAPTVSVGTTTTGAAGSNASVVDGDAGTGLLLNFTIPQGATGPTGPQGSAGADGTDGTGVPSGGTTGQALVKIDATDYNTQWADIAVDTQYHNRFATSAASLRSGATATTELYYTAKADGDGLAESASSDTPTAGKTINRKIYYSEAGFADPDTGTWIEFTPAPADDASFATVKAALLEYLKARTGGTVPISLKQTWEEVAAAPAFTGLLNETYGSGAAAAYGTRRLNGNYSGACMTIRRTDGTTQTIGFVGEEIDESAIETFCTGSTCTVQVWHDQSQTGGTGSGNDATQTSPNGQPTIYTGGLLVKEGGRLALDFQGDSLNQSSFLNSGDDLTFVFVSSDLLGDTGGAATPKYFMYTDTGNVVGSVILRAQSGNTSSNVNSGYSLTNYVDGTAAPWTSREVAYDLFKSGQKLSFNYGSVSVTQSGSDIIIGNRTASSTQSIKGKLQEMLFWTADKSGVRTDIEGNISAYYQSAKLLDESYGSGAEAAYSVRQLKRDNTECMVIRRASGTPATTTIGFDGSGNIDEAAIETFCTGTTCTVYQWLDQSGNGNTATAAASGNEPTIYTGGALVKEGGRLALDFDGSNDALKYTGNFFGGGAASAFSVSSFDNATRAAREIIYGLQDSTGARYDFLLTRQASNAGAGTTQNGIDFYVEGDFEQGLHTITDVNQHLLTAVYSDTVKRDVFDNGVLAHSYSAYNLGTLTDGTDFVIGEDINGGNGIDGNVQEIIVYNADKSGTDQTSIEENIGDYFTQNTPLLDTYSGAAAAYSLRLLDSSYVGSAIRVRRSSDNTEQDINFNVFGELDTVSLLAFAGTGDAFVKTWYDQASTNDATQTDTARQPQIVSSGAVIVDANGKPAIEHKFGGITYAPLQSSLTYSGSDLSIFCAYENDGVTNQWVVEVDFNINLPDGVLMQANSNKLKGYRGASMTGITQTQNRNIGVHIWNGSNVTPYLNGTAGTSDTSSIGTTAFNFSTLQLLNAFDTPAPVYTSEIIIYTSAQSTANRAGIEDNINTFYSIY